MKKREYPEHVIFKDDDPGFNLSDSVSSQECTGLIPWAPENRDELDSYDEIISYSPESANIYKEKR